MRNFIIALFFCILIGCSTMAPLINKNVARQEPYKNQPRQSITISVSKLVDAIGLQKSVGKVYGGTACVEHGEKLWSGFSDNVLNGVTNNIRSKLDEYGYEVLGKANSPFNEEFSRQSKLLLGGKIIDFQTNACYSIKGVKGEVYVKVDWEVYDNSAKSVVMNLSSEGFYSEMEFDKPSDIALVIPAFAMAIDNLLATKEFYTLLTSANRQ